MVAISENFGDLLDSRFKKIYLDEYKEAIDGSMVPMLYGMETSTKAYEMYSGVGAMGDVGLFDGSIDYDSVSQLYDVTVDFPERATGFKVERKLADDDQFGIMDSRPRQMAIAVARTREKSGASPFNGAFVGTDGGDAVSLCNGSHPYSPDDATTQSNAGTSAFSPVSVEATRRIGFNQLYNDRGDILEINYDLILAPVGLEEKAYQLIESKGKVDTADNNANFHQGRYKLAVWRRLSDSNNWFFIDSRLAKLFLKWVDRVKPEYNYDRDSDTLVSKWSVYMRYNTTFAAWPWIYGHKVT